MLSFSRNSPKTTHPMLVYLAYRNIKKEMGHVLGELVFNRSATMYKV